MSSTIRISSKLVRHEYQGAISYSHWCPHCEHAHTYRVQGPGPNWQFDGNISSPTFTPSMREFYPAQKDQPERTICHYYLTSGKIQFCGDCPDGYADQIVDLPDIPGDYGFGGMAFSELPMSN